MATARKWNMTRTFAQNIDNETKDKQNALQVAKWFPWYDKKQFRANWSWIPKQWNFHLGIDKSWPGNNFEQIEMKYQGSGSNGPPGCSRCENMVPRNAKIEAPNPTNGYCEEIKHDTSLCTAQRQWKEGNMFSRWQHSFRIAIGFPSNEMSISIHKSIKTNLFQFRHWSPSSCFVITQNIFWNSRAPGCQGHQGCVLRSNCLLINSQSLLFSYQAMLLSL